MFFKRFRSELPAAVLTFGKSDFGLLRYIIGFIVTINIKLVDVFVHVGLLVARIVVLVRVRVWVGVTVCPLCLVRWRFVLTVSWCGIVLVVILMVIFMCVLIFISLVVFVLIDIHLQIRLFI